MGRKEGEKKGGGVKRGRSEKVWRGVWEEEGDTYQTLVMEKSKRTNTMTSRKRR